MRTCPNCGHEMLNDNFAECPKCGFNLYSHNKKNNSLFSNINKKLPKSIGDISEQITTQVKKEEAYIKSRLDDDSTALVDDNEFFISKTVFDGVDYITNKKQEFKTGRVSKNQNKNTTSVKVDDINQKTEKPKKETQKTDKPNYNNLELSDLQETLINTLPLIDNPSEYEENIINKYAEYNSEQRKELLKDCWTVTRLAEKHNIKRHEVEKAILSDEFLNKDLIGVFKVNPNNIRSLKILYRKPLTETQQKQETENPATDVEDERKTQQEVSVDETVISTEEQVREKSVNTSNKTNQNNKKENTNSRNSHSSTKSEKKEFKEKMTYYFGGFSKKGYLQEQDRKNKKVPPTLKYRYVKEIVQKEFNSGKLQLEDVDGRINEIMVLDTTSLKKDIFDKQFDTSLIKSSDDLIKSLDEHYGREKAQYTHCKEYRKLGLVEKYAVDVTDSSSFDCVIKEEGFKNVHNWTGRAMNKEIKTYTAFVFLFDEYLIILVEDKGVFTIQDKGVKKLYFKDLFDIEFISVTKGKINSNDLYVELFIHFKSSEKLKLAFVPKEYADELKNRFDKYIQENPSDDGATQDNNTVSNADELLKYAELYKQGLLSEEEFEAKKKELL